MVVALWASLPASGSPILSDNFDAPDTANFDGSDQTGRRSGLLGESVQLRSSMIQQGISGGQLSMLKIEGAESRIRFHDAANLANWWNWAAGPGAVAILTEGGMRVEFDWIPADNTSDDWIAFNIGFPNSGAEPAVRVNEAGTDFGILFRNSGGTQYFDNGVAATGPSFDVPDITTHHVVLDYAFASFADGTPVTLNVTVDGTQILIDHVFEWAGNGGRVAMELGNLAQGTLIDNFAVSTLGILQPDTDADGLLDSWEQAKAGNLTDLNGLLNGPGPGAGTGNFDGDSLTDAQEFMASLAFPAYPEIDPKLADTDADGLEDGAELNGLAPRPPTNPTNPDTDGDGLNDLIETNSGTFVNAGDPGTNPANSDTDGDHFPDFYEIQRGSSPHDAGSLPTAPAGIALGIVTDEASTGISVDQTFTHKISGGGPVSVNGVDLDALTATETPLDFSWEASAGKFIIGPAINNNIWVPASGGVTGDGNLGMFGTFSYSGGLPGSTQQFILSGLQPGQSNEVRLFIRKWANDTVRPAAIKFTNGTEITDYFVLEDRPSIMLDNLNDNSAYFISFRYVATGSELVIDTIVPNVPSASGSFHLYGLTNRIVPLPGDTDADGLADTWEMEKAGNLTDLNGLKTGPGPGADSGDFDADGLTDAQEYSLSRITFPSLHPKTADSDGDGVNDGAELNPTAPRLETDPTLADTDADGLSDGAESNTGIFADANNAGTNPRNTDTDGDHFPDGYEVQNGGNPIDPELRPSLPTSIAIGIVTDEESTGISSSETYTHKMSGGAIATVNGVDLDPLTNTETPVDFEWNQGVGDKNIIGPAINNNIWVPANGGVTGDGNLQMFGTFTYAGTGPTPGNSQRFVLSGLQAGQNYEFRLFIRKWANETVRPALLKLTNGGAATEVFILEDRPGVMTGSGEDNTAYYLSFSYVAQTTELVLEATVPNVPSADGSFHLYGLTNRVAGPVVPPPVIVGITRAPNGASVTLTFASQPARTYAVDTSTLLTASGQPGGWTQVTNAVASQGSQTVFVDTQFSNQTTMYYRVRDVTP
jgi:hypothetical protein